MRIERIHNGIVLDHIKAGTGIEILKLFPTDILKTKIDYASFIDSPTLGQKDIIKIENLVLETVLEGVRTGKKLSAVGKESSEVNGKSPKSPFDLLQIGWRKD